MVPLFLADVDTVVAYHVLLVEDSDLNNTLETECTNEYKEC